MATVYLAHDRRVNRDVAVKVLSPALAADPRFVERFRREAQNAAALNHPNIVAVYDWGSHEGAHFIVMEYVPGSTLRDVIVRRGARPEAEALAIGAEVADALGAAHAHGVVHRDVKPHNVLLDTEGGVKVTDFGIARATGESQLTDTGTILGSAHYAAPELIERRPVDARSDVYGLGAVLYELLTGRPPFTGEGPVAIAWQHVHEAPLPPAQVAAGVSPAAERVVLKALEKAPEQRYQSAAEMAAALRAVLARDPRAVGVPTPRPSPIRSAAGAPLPAAPTAPAAVPTTVPASMSVPAAGTEPIESPAVVQPASPTRARSASETVLLTPVVRARPMPARRGPAAPALGVAALLVIAPLGLLLFRGWDLTQIAGVPPPAPAPATAEPRLTAEGVAGVRATAAEPSRTTVPAEAASTTPPPRPTAAAAPTSAPVVLVASVTPAGSPASRQPTAAVASFYAAIAEGEFGQAAALWSPRMRAQYPPAEFIDQRFAQTQRLALNAARLVAQNGDRATVAVDLTEVIGSPPETRRWVGTWALVWTPSGWLLDAPSLARA